MNKRYLVVYAKVPNSNFAGMSPDVPGCISTGNTLETMRARMRKALEFHLESIVEEGDHLPEPHTTSVDFTENDFEGVDYFVIEYLEVALPKPEKHHAASAA